MTDNGKPLILAIDTALDDCSAALFDAASGEIVAARTETIGRGHAERLPGVIDAVLQSGLRTFVDIGTVAVTVGPGSFTGVRVGVAAARGYALALGVPSLGVTTLEAMARTGECGGPVLAVHDAKRGEVYALLLDEGGAVVRGPEALAPQDLADFCSPIAGPLDVTGSGSHLAVEALARRAVSIRNASSAVDIETVARLAASSEAPYPVKPLYLRSADAKLPSRSFSLFAEKA